MTGDVTVILSFNPSVGLIVIATPPLLTSGQFLTTFNPSVGLIVIATGSVRRYRFPRGNGSKAGIQGLVARTVS
jgi:hypothetical protein